MTIFYIKKLKSIFIIFDENKSIMKRIIVLLTLTILIFSQILFINQAQAQSIELIGDSYVYGNPAMPIASHIIVKNITSNSLDVRCQKNIIDTIKRVNSKTIFVCFTFKAYSFESDYKLIHMTNYTSFINLLEIICELDIHSYIHAGSS